MENENNENIEEQIEKVQKVDDECDTKCVKEKISKLKQVDEFNFSKLGPHEYATSQFLKFDDFPMSWAKIILYFVTIIIIIYCIVSEGSYMQIDYGIGSSLLNVEGTSSADLSESNMARMIFDNYDIRIPEQEKNAIFIATHVIGYKQQQRSKPNNEQNECIDIATKCPCESGEYTPNGIATGECINSKCLINGWCTSDKNTNENFNLQQKYDALLDGIDNMLVTFQIMIEFPIFGVSKIVSLNERKLGYNVWRVGDILKGIDEEYINIRNKGIIIVINMNWECDYYSLSNECNVDWNLFRADNKNTKNTGNYLWISNYEPGQMVEINGIKLKVLESRFLQKIYGIKILFNVTGEMKKFSIIALIVNIGSMAGILSIIPFLLDVILRRRKENYSKMKDSDMNERQELHSKWIKQLLLQYLKGQEIEYSS
eukprot:35299_1